MANESSTAEPPGLRAHLARLFPGATITAIEPLGPDAGAKAKSAGAKAAGTAENGAAGTEKGTGTAENGAAGTAKVTGAAENGAAGAKKGAGAAAAENGAAGAEKAAGAAGAGKADGAGATEKAAGYGLPVRISLRDGEGRRELVWRVASSNPFGHDRRADRAAVMVQAFDDFAQIPHHVRAVDLGVVAGDALISTRSGGEHYLITSYAPGSIYAHDLRRIASERIATPHDVARVDTLARYLAELHTPIAPPGTRYRRAIRDLLGSGEGIFGILDGYPPETPGAPADRLREIEARCAAWRWHLRDRDSRLTRTHGDFHPFNIVFDGDTPTLLDASRGACGDPADDLTALAVNYILFALDAPASWRHGLGALWRQLWHRYLTERPDPDLLSVAPPFFAWRALVVANPTFYPALSVTARDKLLGFAERTLDAGALDPTRADELFR